MTTDVETNEPTTAAGSKSTVCETSISCWNKSHDHCTFKEDGWSRWNEDSCLWWFNFKAFNCVFGTFSAYSVNAIFSLFTVNGIFGLFLVNGMWSILSVNSVFSILSINSTFSILSENSTMSVGCSNAAYQICYGQD